MLLHFATRRTRARSSVPEALVAATSKHQSQGKLDLARVIGPGNSAKAAAGDSGRQIVKARMVKHVEPLVNSARAAVRIASRHQRRILAEVVADDSRIRVSRDVEGGTTGQC